MREICAHYPGEVQLCACKPGAHELTPHEFGAAQVCARQVRRGEIGIAEVQIMKISMSQCLSSEACVLSSRRGSEYRLHFRTRKLGRHAAKRRHDCHARHPEKIYCEAHIILAASMCGARAVNAAAGAQ